MVGKWKMPVHRFGIAVGVLALSLGVGSGAYSLFQTSTSPTVQPLAAGTVTLALGGSGSSNSLSVGAKGMLAGSSVSREVVLDNTGTVGFASVSVGVTASPSNALSTDSTDGLQVQVMACSAAWTATSLSDGGYSYTCPGTKTTVGAAGPVASYATPVALSAPANTIGASASEALVVEVQLPTGAPNSLEGLSTSLTWTFTGTQAPGGPQ